MACVIAANATLIVSRHRRLIHNQHPILTHSGLVNQLSVASGFLVLVIQLSFPVGQISTPFSPLGGSFLDAD